MRAVVIGATGMVGMELVRQLLANDSFSKVLCLSRRELSLKDQKLETIHFQSLDELTSMIIPSEEDCYFCCLGTTMKKAGSKKEFEKVDYHGALNFAQLAKNHRAKSFVLVSAAGAAIDSPFYYSKIKARTEQAVEELGFDHFLVFRPGLLVGQRAEHRPLESLGLKAYHLFGAMIPGRLKRKFATEVSDLARQMIQQALRPTGKKEIIESSEIAKN